VKRARSPQIDASDPRASVFVTANAGSGKTSTLVTRVARLLLDGAAPEAILCVTFTKAAAAEMQRRLFARLGEWAVMDDGTLAGKLAEIGETGRNLHKARALFARALETPGGLKILTIHAFCEKLLRRFPLEAGVSPGFSVLDDAAAAEVSHGARAQVAELALRNRHLGEAYDHFSIHLAFRAFEGLFDTFAANAAAIRGFFAACEGRSFETETWRRMGFPSPADPAELETEALARTRTARWRRMAEVIAASGKKSEATLGSNLLAAAEATAARDVARAFFTDKGEPRKVLESASIPPDARRWLKEEADRLGEALERLAAAELARTTVFALRLAWAYLDLYGRAKEARGALDFADLIERSGQLLSRRADAEWVLYKLDGGLDHLLLDESQDTAPEQWSVLKRVTDAFFDGDGARSTTRTVFTVGDEKQSIFSFQGADPARLAREVGVFRVRALAGGAASPIVRLTTSYRSAPDILDFVDRVFADPEALAGLTAAGENLAGLPPTHLAHRTDHGTVDLWPLEAGRESEEEVDPWDPVDKPPALGGARLLADRLAEAIAGMVGRGEAVADRETGLPRPCRYGDVLILVRRRRALFEEITRALKRRNIPAAGADRLKLSSHGAFGDLVALGRFARFPADDLSLAVLLRSPFCDVDEEGLFALAHGREASLWRMLQHRASERRAWADAARFLAWAVAEAVAAAPFDFYCAALERLDAEGRSMRQRILTRLGLEAEQAVEAFVAQTLAAEQAGAADLERLLVWMEGLDLDIKREQDEAGADEVRVMTVHGAKGLEAPIVILPDTATPVTWQGSGLIADGEGGFIWKPAKSDDCARSRAIKDARAAEAKQEGARLLYVALTRPRDRLIVCGVAPRRSSALAGSWYDFAERAFDRAGQEARVLELPDGGEGRRLGADPVLAVAPAVTPSAVPALPAWNQGLAPAERLRGRRISPSQTGEEDAGPAPSPLAEVGGLGRWRRGEIIHRLFQVLPDLPPDARRAAAARLLAREPGLSEAQRAEMAVAAFGVLEDARFAAVFGPGSRAEAAIAGGAATLPDGATVSGRLDRLVVAPDRVLVADFKTNRPAPARIEDADPAYLRQMAIYRAVLAEVFPGRAIEAALVWTDGPALMPVPDALMDQALAELAA
jgi:ATP-dependent helicase/nuclease subunit A